MARALILGCRGPELGAAERAFLSRVDPWGFILFGRNVAGPEQLRRLTADLRDAVGRDAPILIDQEGGRVARLRAPAWREWRPALEDCARLPAGLRERAMRLRYELIASELLAVGVDVDCAPVLDLALPDTHAIIRDRAYGSDPEEVARIGRAVAEGLLAGGVLPVMKHIPGHGRARVDSHLDLPRVGASRAELAADFAPFQALADLPMAMTAHIVFEAIDDQAPATLSPAMVALIRGEIGFDGLLMSDDLSMKALSGPFGARAERALAAGVDMLLHCNGEAAEAAAVAEAAPRLAGRAAERAAAALALRRGAGAADTAALDAEFASLGRANA
jgi:beta-N-acetylhexosaminidase